MSAHLWYTSSIIPAKSFSILLLVLRSGERDLRNHFILKIQNILHRCIKGKAQLLIWHDHDLLKTTGRDEMLVITIWEDQIWRVLHTDLANAFIQPRPYCSCCIYLQSGSPSGSPLWKFWHRSTEKPATETPPTPPSQCLPKPTGRFGPAFAHNGQITTINLWVCACSARGKKNCKTQSPAEMFHQHWGHCTDESHLEQEILSKSMQQRLDCVILRKCKEQLRVMVF